MCFSIKKKLGDEKKNYLYVLFFVSNYNFNTKHLKDAQNSRFAQVCCSNF